MIPFLISISVCTGWAYIVNRHPLRTSILWFILLIFTCIVFHHTDQTILISPKGCATTNCKQNYQNNQNNQQNQNNRNKNRNQNSYCNDLNR